jgi:hypothetical protein
LGVSVIQPIRNLLGIVLVLLLSSFAEIAHARCVLPVPDGGGEAPSRANVEGYIISIDKDLVVIRPHGTKRRVSVRVPQDKPIFSAFGGDDHPSELRVGQKAWVWFVGCKHVGKEVPVSAYFQIYSKDPNDRP